LKSLKLIEPKEKVDINKRKEKLKKALKTYEKIMKNSKTEIDFK
jgi:hypothetical protein